MWARRDVHRDALARARAVARRVTYRSSSYVQAAKATVAGARWTADTLDGSTVTDVPIAADGNVAGRRPPTTPGSRSLMMSAGREKPEGSADTMPNSRHRRCQPGGTKAMTDFWEAYILNPGSARCSRNGGAPFEESAQLETDSAPWTLFAAAFQQQRGDSLLPDPPLVAKNDEKVSSTTWTR